MTTWSRGMIPALGAGGPGFESLCGPIIKNNFYYNFKYIYYINYEKYNIYFIIFPY